MTTCDCPLLLTESTLAHQDMAKLWADMDILLCLHFCKPERNWSSSFRFSDDHAVDGHLYLESTPIGWSDHAAGGGIEMLMRRSADCRAHSRQLRSSVRHQWKLHDLQSKHCFDPGNSPTCSCPTHVQNTPSLYHFAIIYANV